MEIKKNPRKKASIRSRGGSGGHYHLHPTTSYSFLLGPPTAGVPVRHPPFGLSRAGTLTIMAGTDPRGNTQGRSQ